VAVPTHADIVLAAADERTASEAELEVLFEIAFRTVCQSCTPK